MLSDDINRALTACEALDDEDLEQFARILWKKMKERRNRKAREDALLFDVGDRVQFEGKKRDGSPIITGTVLKVLLKTCKIKPDDNPFMTWKVPFSFLTHI